MGSRQVQAYEGRVMNAAIISSAIAHALAWLASLWLAFWPVAYQGVSATAVEVTPEMVEGRPGPALQQMPPVAQRTPIPATGQPRRTSASLIEVNGLRVLALLLIPVALTGLALLAALVRHRHQTGSRVYLWASAFLFLAFCAMAIFSIGAFYLPAALVLLVAAVAGSRRKPADAKVSAF
jgi:hypothetical protein